ncbi:alpha-L RNA-binding motif-containing protein [Aspergillus japonicus CBS 114.51]|uniref:Small ribosomal subunit protein uS4m n=2 Tax=Aspergillus TaxID=5052 RepID=A0A2V5I6Z5_ASPV1|nr:alpha-L RNA-binding motif-containing protein [Aspergillus japonicus CBS 114.51]PYI19847.1 alpha-L RNA-binding motif-containing protein [Aspergillus violaceofuscus CBS 115571]RAH78490.1 alpha-L RNA-binding motif-containing protein [Aspergillus japonicus CBS 114.51]
MRNRATTPLKQPKIRQSWSKYNLYNLSRLRDSYRPSATFFQQKWKSKAAARAYHGEQVSEKQWSRMFSPRLRSVVPMAPSNLARDDGSAMSAGRGSGLTKAPKPEEQPAFGEFDEEEEAARSKLTGFEADRKTPYVQMTFAPLERRLDTAIFRAMFASSARQARQFVVHGAVKVNGKPMRYPGYLLNPGDMFQVEPERVMYATGAPKDKVERRQTRVARKKAAEEAKKAEEAAEEAAAEEASTPEEATKEEPTPVEAPRETLKALMAQAKAIMNSSKDVLPAKRKQDLRGFQKAVRRVLSRSGNSTVLTANLEEQFSELTTLLKAKRAEKKPVKAKEETEKKEGGEEKQKAEKTEESATEKSESKDATPKAGENGPITTKLSEAFRQAIQNPEKDVDTSELSDDEFEVLRRALVQMRDNPVDSTKPYATPWRPRDYMSAFATIPRYLEVNHNICAAVYLRHPVARPGFAEVPTPFGEKINTPAFVWYLRRR